MPDEVIGRALANNRWSDVLIAVTLGYWEVPIYVTLIPDALNGEGDSIEETLSDKVIRSKKGSKTHQDNIHCRGDAFWVVPMLDEEDELNINKVTTLVKLMSIDQSSLIRRVRCLKTHRDSLRYQRNIFKVMSMPDGQNATKGGYIKETITIGRKGNTLLRCPMKQSVKVTPIKRKLDVMGPSDEVLSDFISKADGATRGINRGRFHRRYIP